MSEAWIQVGRVAARTLALVLVVSCANAPLATPTARIVVPTPAPAKPTEAPTPGAPAKPAVVPVAKAAPAATRPAEPRGRPGGDVSREKPPSPPLAAGEGEANRKAVAPGPGARRVRLTAADGYVVDGEGLSPFANDHPAVGKLAPELRAAVQRAATDAARDGVDLRVTSGWRSARYQQSLLDAAVAQYGSEAEARRWVSTTEKSDHVTGRAVDVGPAPAQLWLREHGERYGLCQTYANEVWHYELATAPGGTCPRPIADASAG